MPKKSWDQLLQEYHECHLHPTNRKCHAVGIPLIVGGLLLAPFKLYAGGVLFVVGWTLQFIGHKIEGKKPAFISDWRHLLVGPLYFLQKLTRKKP